MEKLLLTAEEAAELIGVKRCTIYDLMRLRILPSVKIGRYRRVPVSALRQYVDQLVAEQAS
jgi:excisionase family DNA binding protein